MCFYPWPQTADSPFGQNLFAKQGFADRSFVFYYFLYLGSFGVFFEKNLKLNG